MKMTGAQILLECLLEQGVDTVFGYPGGTILNVYDELELHGYKDKIRHILTAHEQGASHAADGYARATGKVGVCFATSGPGATNLTTGIATAYYGLLPRGVHHLQRRRRTSSARTPFRRSTSPASPCPSPSATTWCSDRGDAGRRRCGRPSPSPAPAAPAPSSSTSPRTSPPPSATMSPCRSSSTPPHGRLGAMLIAAPHQQPEDARAGSRRRGHPRST